MEKFTDIQDAELFYSFEKVAANYLLTAERKEQKLYAVHPQIRKAWQQNTESDRRTAAGSGREGNSMVHIAQLENIVYTGNWWGESFPTP